jgi:hypothetical protein
MARTVPSLIALMTDGKAQDRGYFTLTIKYI